MTLWQSSAGIELWYFSLAHTELSKPSPKASSKYFVSQSAESLVTTIDIHAARRKDYDLTHKSDSDITDPDYERAFRSIPT